MIGRRESEAPDAQSRSEQRGGKPVRMAGLDVARTLALFLVLYQHVVTVSHYTELPVNVMGLNAGQSGVGLFCFLSGFLAMQSKTTARAWIIRKVARIAPSYWIMLVAATIGNAFVGYKTQSLKSLVMQFAGLSHFVPASQRLNVATWFITLLIFCYAIALAVVVVDGLRLKWFVLSLLTVVTVAVLAQGVDVSFVRQILTFEIGMMAHLIVHRSGGWSHIFWLGLLLVCLILAGIDAKYALLSGVVVVVLVNVSVLGGFVFGAIARYSYEIFLMHGLVLVLFLVVMNGVFMLYLPMALVVTVVSSYFLKKISSTLENVVLMSRWAR